MSFWSIILVLLYRSVSTRAVIGQFSGAYSTLQPAEFKSLFQSPCKLPEIFALEAKIQAEINSVRNLQYGLRTRLVRGISFTDLAHKKKTEQSSTTYNGFSSRAVDENYSTYYDDKSCTHTNKEMNPWWRVDLGREYIVTGS